MMCQMQKNAKFWSNIWGVKKEHNRETEGSKIWQERVNDERPQERVSISVKKIRKQCRKIPNWKAPGRERVSKGIRSRTSAVYTNVFQKNRILIGDDLPEWMTHSRTVLCQKDPQKGNTADNYWPITWPINVETFNRNDSWGNVKLPWTKKILPQGRTKRTQPKEVVEQRINCWLKRWFKRIARKDTPIHPWHG